MPSRRELIEARKKELSDLGYSPGIIEKAIDWSTGCAEGMARYVKKAGVLDYDENFEALVVQFLPRYLKDCESWIRRLGHERGEH
jgi:hypothetical protein